jgi:alpha-tubulin suppressor-like RCC1 family protein
MVSLGSGFGCAVTSTGGVKCWGSNSSGNLGDGTSTLRSTPADVTGLSSGAVRGWAGGYHACAEMTAGSYKCWGWNQYGQLGDGTKGGTRFAPVDVIGLSGATTLSLGQDGSCALMPTGGVKCKGYNNAGQLRSASVLG